MSQSCPVSSGQPRLVGHDYTPHRPDLEECQTLTAVSFAVATCTQPQPVAWASLVLTSGIFPASQIRSRSLIARCRNHPLSSPGVPEQWQSNYLYP